MESPKKVREPTATGTAEKAKKEEKTGGQETTPTNGCAHVLDKREKKGVYLPVVGGRAGLNRVKKKKELPSAMPVLAVLCCAVVWTNLTQAKATD